MTATGPRRDALAALAHLLILHADDIRDALVFAADWHAESAHQRPRKACNDDCDLCANARRARRWRGLAAHLDRAVQAASEPSRSPTFLFACDDMAYGLQWNGDGVKVKVENRHKTHRLLLSIREGFGSWQVLPVHQPERFGFDRPPQSFEEFVPIARRVLLLAREVFGESD